MSEKLEQGMSGRYLEGQHMSLGINLDDLRGLGLEYVTSFYSDKERSVVWIQGFGPKKSSEIKYDLSKRRVVLRDDFPLKKHYYTYLKKGMGEDPRGTALAFSMYLHDARVQREDFLVATGQRDKQIFGFSE